MNRRQFLRYSAFCGLSASLGRFFPLMQTPFASADDKPFLKGLQMIDAHAHPDGYAYGSQAGRD